VTRSWHIRDVYHDYLNGKISWEQVVETAELGLVEFEQRYADGFQSPRPSTPPTIDSPLATGSADRIHR
jgi:hypothetical protein